MKIIEEIVYKSKQEMSWRVTYGFREQLSTYRSAVIPGLITDNLFKCAFFFFFQPFGHLSDRVIESLRLENTSKIIESNCPLTTHSAH